MCPGYLVQTISGCGWIGIVRGGFETPQMPTSKSHRPDAPAQSSRDSADNCLICHFVAQGQLTVATTCDCFAPLVTEIEVPELPVCAALAPSCPIEPTCAPPAAPAPSA